MWRSLLLVLWPLLACGRLAGGLDAGTVPLDGGLNLFSGLALDQRDDAGRSFHFYAPPRDASERRPVVVLLHGNGGSANQLLGRGGESAPFKRWLAVAERERLFVLVPDGTAGGWNDCRGDATTNPTSDDVAFIERLVHGALPHGVDASRVFATGISNGGHMALRLAIERPELVRGVGLIAAAWPAQSKCRSPRAPVSVVLINGTADPILPFDGGVIGTGTEGRGSTLSLDDTLAQVRALNGLVNAELRAMRPDVVTTDGCRVVERVTQATFPGLSAIVIEGGGHTEPSPSERYSALFLRLVGRQSADLEMADEVWAFFARQ